jgi:hypothetical protein
MPEETREFDKVKGEIVTVQGATFMRFTLQPGWRWSESVKPSVKTESCQAPYLSYQISGPATCPIGQWNRDGVWTGRCYLSSNGGMMPGW